MHEGCRDGTETFGGEGQTGMRQIDDTRGLVLVSRNTASAEAQGSLCVGRHGSGQGKDDRGVRQS
jgi:hypothetical protein